VEKLSCQIVLKTNFEKDLRRFRVESKTFNHAQLQDLLQQLYGKHQSNFVLKYQDEEGDMITIGNDLDLGEAFRWITERNRIENTTKNQYKLVPLHIVVMSESSDNMDSSHLVGITNLFLEKLKNLTISSSEESTKTHTTTSDSTSSSSYNQIMVNTEWRGSLTYLDEEKENFPFVLRITRVKGKFIEGLIHWETLDAVTKWLGKTRAKNNKFIFREYEAVSGEDNVALPSNYTCELVGDTIKGHLISEKKRLDNS